MKDQTYSTLRKLFFWLFFLIFTIFTPILVFYSLGYKFDFNTKKFLKTGAISIKTLPEKVDIYWNGRKVSESSPYVLRGLLPKIYTLAIEKKGFYSYKTSVEIKPYFVSEIDVTLLPQVKHMEKIEQNFNIYKFFTISRFLSERIIAFTDQGIYLLGKDFKWLQKIASLDMDIASIKTIANLREGKNKLIFWNQSKIWMIDTLQNHKEETQVKLIYNTGDIIKNVFFGLKDKYLIIHDGMKIIALDSGNCDISFRIIELKNTDSNIFYDSASDELYIRDQASSLAEFSLFKINFTELINEKRFD